MHVHCMSHGLCNSAMVSCAIYHCYMFGLEPNSRWILRPIYQNEFAEVIDHFGCISPVFPFTAFSVVRGAASADGDAVSYIYTCACLFTAPLNSHQTLFLINDHDGCVATENYSNTYTCSWRLDDSTYKSQ